MEQSLDSSGPEFQAAVAAAFKPEQEKKAADICKKGTDGSGHIEGTVWERGRAEDGCWMFVLTFQGGKRAQILLSGSISRYFDSLPIAAGARVRLCLRSLSLEETSIQRFFLNKRFAWRDGVVIYIRSKTGQEAFYDTFPGDASPPSPSIVPQKRKRSPPTISSGATFVESEADNTTADVHECVQPLPPSAIADVEMNVSKPTELGPDSQNPQSLPSPPPEMHVGEDESALGHEYNHPTNDRPVSLRLPLETTLARPTENELTSSGGLPSKTKTKRRIQENPQGLNMTAQARKKLRVNQERNKKKHAKRAAAHLKPKQAILSENGDVDEDQYYWDHAELDIPDELLTEDTGQPVELPTVHLAPLAPPSRHGTPEQAPASQPSNDSKRDPIESLRAGCVTSFGTYTPLVEFGGIGPQHIVGIVSSVSPPTETKNGDFMARFALFDPSNFATSGLNVTLFEKSLKALPQVNMGDVLLLQHVAVDNFSAFCAVGASYRPWRWASFNVKTGMVSSAPQDTTALRHIKLEKSELHHCLLLGDWWRDVSSTAISFGTGIDTSVPITNKRTRQHKLMSEAQFEEYFDCTVEILHGTQNDNSVHNVYKIYVTDYTRNQFASPTQGSWCPPKLAEVVVPVELWESSTALGPTMQAGEFYSIRNIKLRMGGGGYVEGKMVEAEKITKLDEDELENRPHLVALLRRKREWEAIAKTSGGIHEFPHQLIEEVEENHHFCCTAEVVHISGKDDYLYLYITDYTMRSDLVPVSAVIASGVLVDRVVRISVYDAQVDTAKSLEAGDFIAIRNLRLRPSGNENRLCGRLGGDQRLITKLNPKAAGNPELKALLKRKKEVVSSQATNSVKNPKGARATRQVGAAAQIRESSASTTSSTKAKGKGKAVATQYLTLDEVKGSDTCPGVFRVQARVVDFFPDDLRDCTILRCTSSSGFDQRRTMQDPPTRRRCTNCDDAMDDNTFVRAFFRLFFRIADEAGTTLDVSVSEERCSVLKDLDPDEVYEDDEAFMMLVARVKSLVRDLLCVCEGEARRRPGAEDGTPAEAPLLDLTLGSWLPEGEPDMVESRAYIVLKHTVYDGDG
ncbi:hypothetical protein C8Q80DRAFT_1104088 [Daedaleopsis nitida]|nr:hypothetical protein C8Q80DRAFT_1104088 [Daedaleopsis nitida]